MEKIVSLHELYEMDFSFLHPVAMEQYWYGKEGFSMTKPRPMHALLLVRACEVALILPDGTSIVGKKGDVFLLPRGSRYNWIFSNTRKESPSTLLIEFSLLSDVGETLLLDGAPRRVEGVDGEALVPFFETAITSLNAPVTGWARAKAALYSLLAEVSGVGRLHRTASGGFSLIARSIQYLEEDPLQSLSMREVAALSSVSTNYFEQLFKAYAGKTPIEYRALRRLERAEKLLRDSLLSVGEIAALLGFEDEAYFCRFFKKRKGISPGVYRRGGL